MLYRRDISKSIECQYLLCPHLPRSARQINEVKHKAQQQVFSQLSQDLRTPMSAIIGTSEIIKNTATGDEELQRHDHDGARHR